MWCVVIVRVMVRVELGLGLEGALALGRLRVGVSDSRVRF